MIGPREKPWYWDTKQAAGNFRSAMMSTPGGRHFAQGLGESVGMSFAGKPALPSWLKSLRQSGASSALSATRIQGAISSYESFLPREGAYTGILGWKQELNTVRAESAAMKQLGMEEFVSVHKKIGYKGLSNLGKISGRRALGIVGKMGFRGLIGPAFVGYGAYTGYQEGGTLGAIVGGGQEALLYAGMYVAMKAIPSVAAVLGPVAIAAGVGVAAYTFGENARQYRKGLRNVEMGGDVVDPFGTGATMRQRSVAAIQNSHINGRTALGSEGQIFHR